MTQSVCVLGRQPALGLAELESLFGPHTITPAGSNTVIVDMPPVEIPLEKLGGTLKVAKLLTSLPFRDWKQIETYIAAELPKHVCCLPPGKIRFGISVHGIQVNTKVLNASGLSFKRVIKGAGRSVRVVPNKDLELSSAQVIHNQLTGPTGMELLVIRQGDGMLLAQTTAVQDIAAYAARDQARPKRDARVGMLPPKLAQIIINLATGPIPERQDKKSLLDPFCGTGVVLQEALLMGFDVCGTDLEPRMIEYSGVNLEWLRMNKPEISGLVTLAVGDATEHQWPAAISTVAGETYLGRPFSAAPKPDVLQDVMSDVDTIHKKFLKNLAAQTRPGFRLCIAVPAWKTSGGFKHLRTLDHLEEIGYTRASFVHALDKDLIYHREGQIVGRELAVLTRK